MLLATKVGGIAHELDIPAWNRLEAWIKGRPAQAERLA
jgi:hypothetical protein